MDHPTELNKHWALQENACCKFRDGLLQAFGIDVGKDNMTVHPQTFCNTCYSKMQQRICEEQSRPITSALKAQEWTPHTDGECGVRSLFASQQKGGRPRSEGKNREKPSRDTPQQMSTAIHHQAPPSWRVSQPLEPSQFLPPGSNISLAALHVNVW